MWVATLLALHCASSNYTHLYKATPHAPSFTEADIGALKYMGPLFADNGVNFAIYSENATKVELLLFDSQDANDPSKTFDLTRIGNVWSVYVQGLGAGQVYGYRAWGANWPYDSAWVAGNVKGFVSDVDDKGNRYNPNKLLFDPYSKGITRGHDWSKGSAASGPSRAVSDYGAALKSVVVLTGPQSKYAWTPSEADYRSGRQDPNFKGHKWNDLIIYEVHPKGFTMNSASGVAHPGTYRGVGEMADYFKNLGVTAVQLMPVFQKPADGGYWGYQTLSYFSPESTYASVTLPQERIDEFKWMVDQLHQRNIEVILDVVYNHTGEGGLWREKIQFGGGTLDQTLDPRNWGNFDPKQTAGIFAYRGIDNQSYYALKDTDRGLYNDDATGVGNAMRANYPPFRKLILDSLEYWVNEMHVDGFRFDLATELGEPDKTFDCGVGAFTSHGPNYVQQTVLQDIVDDISLQAYNTRLIAEPWGENCYGLGGFPASTLQPGNGWYEHNGQFRDWWRSFVNHHPEAPVFDPKAKPPGSSDPDWWRNWQLGDSNGNMYGSAADGAFLLFGSRSMFYDPVGNTISKQRKPYNSINFVTVHDGMTLYDAFSYRVKNNGCGPLAPDCCQPVTAYCNNDGTDDNRSFDWKILSDDELVACHADKGCVDGCGGRNPPPPDVQTCRNYWCGSDQGCVQTALTSHEAIKRQLMRNMFTAMMVARGTPMLLGGDEWMRTQLGNNNSYTSRSDNAFNWFDWGAWYASDEAWRMHDFVAKLVQFRKDHSYIFAPSGYDSAPPLEWMSPKGGAPVWSCGSNDADDCGRTLMVHYPAQSGPEVTVLLNMSYSNTVSFTLPPGNWVRLVDTDARLEMANPAAPHGSPDARVNGNVTTQNPVPISGNTYLVNPKSFVVLQAF